MSSFTALNAEPEDDVSSEVDDTREIQQEEALKLYQTALKFHSLGPTYYDQAADAYRELFKSEIFGYPDAVSEFHRDEVADDDAEDDPPEQIELDLDLLPSASTQTTPSSLPQILYLAFKNYGQFLLEKTLRRSKEGVTEDQAAVFKICAEALKRFGDALERDDTDLDLWRKGARLAQLCASDRIIRFCLESVLVGDDDTTNEVVDILGLDEAMASIQLRQLVVDLRDDLSLAQRTANEPRRDLLEVMLKKNDPFPYLPVKIAREHDGFHKLETRTLSTSPTWLGVGQSLLQSLNEETTNTCAAAQPIRLEIPDDSSDDDSFTTVADEVSSPSHPEPLDEALTSNQEVGDEQAVSRVEKAEPSPASVPGDPEDTKMIETPQTDGDVSTREEGTDSPQGVTTRKRSAASAGHDDPADGSRSKSKRIRNRGVNMDPNQQDEDITQSKAHNEKQLQEIALADIALFDVATDLLSAAGLTELTTLEELQEPKGPGETQDGTIIADLRSSFSSWSEEKGQAASQGQKSMSTVGEKAGLTLFLEHSKSAASVADTVTPLDGKRVLLNLISDCNARGMNRYQAALRWLEALLLPTVQRSGRKSSVLPSTYCAALWPEELKRTVVNLIVRMDNYLYKHMLDRLKYLERRRLTTDRPFKYALQDAAEVEMVQALYELHLDIFCSITNPSSQVDLETRLSQQDCLSRWGSIAASFINILAETSPVLQQKLIIRYVWTATTQANMAPDASREHIMLCLEDLTNLLTLAHNSTIILPNNAAIPEISTSALEQEISRTSTLEFFTKIFDGDSKDPVLIIESLDPILEPRSDLSPQVDSEQKTPQGRLVEFLESGDASLKLFLWRRLREAYSTIDYPPKVFSCRLRSIETIFSEVTSSRHARLTTETRELECLKWLKEVDDHATALLAKADRPDAFETVDEQHIKSSLSSIARICRMLHGIVLLEDSFRNGSLPEPKKRKSLDAFREKMRDMYVKLWTLQYILLKEAIAQKVLDIVDSGKRRLEYLSSLHDSLGHRGYCKQSKKMFLKFLKSELVELSAEQDCGPEVAQVLYDLHELRLTPGIGDADHGCPTEPLDRQAASQVVETVIRQAQNMSIKDLLKSDLKSAIDMIQLALGSEKPCRELSVSRKSITAFLKSPIIQTQLFRASRGEVNLPMRIIECETSGLAARGWYFMLGHLALAKFKSVKRSSAGPVDDLDAAVAFFRQDLEHDAEKWETWFRLAQVYDAKLEEDLGWSADKMNSHRPELAVLQRNAIHCYEMATAIALSHAVDTSETNKKVSELYTAFAMRLYASTREPLSMDVFDNSFQQRSYFSTGDESKVYQAPSHPSMSMFSVWRLASHFFRRALVEMPRSWVNHYSLGKCLWKMLSHPDRTSRRHVEMEEVLEAFSESIRLLPPRKDSRTDPILEPHFKLVSVVHKLVKRERLTPTHAKEALQVSHYARKVDFDEEESWDTYVGEILVNLRNADKSNWHHRIRARAAHSHYDDNMTMTGALLAKNEFHPQIFTKSMVLMVWKPENERPGRHFVYTSRYVLFFVTILKQLNDRVSMEMLIRRIRKKSAEYLNHQHVWEQVITSYADTLRGIAKVPAGTDDSRLRTMDYNLFTAKADDLETWAMRPDTSHVVLEILRDAVELKKVNSSLMKGSLFDDLIADCYATLFLGYVDGLPAKTADPGLDFTLSPQNSDDGSRRMKLDTILAQSLASTEQPTMPAPQTKPARLKQVTRREMVRKAEGLVVRPPPIKTPTLLKTSIFPRQLPESTPSSKPSAVSLAGGNGEDPSGVKTGESSRRASLHDSADDESELSGPDDHFASDEEEFASDEEDLASNDDELGKTQGKDGVPKLDNAPGVRAPTLFSEGQERGDVSASTDETAEPKAEPWR